jgi:hypothetical protein
MSRLTYLSLCIASNQKESDDFFKEIRKYKWTPAHRPHTIYYISLHTTVRSPHNGIWKWQDGVLEGPLFKSSAETWNGILRGCLRHLLATYTSAFDGLLYSGHGGAVHVGRWIRNSSAFFKMCDLVSLFEEHRLRFPVMCFNACYMGSFLSLLECERITPWVAADPGYAEWESMTATTSFWKRSGPVGPWLQSVTNEYGKRYPHYAYKCYMVFDLHVMPALFREMKQTNPMHWNWSRDSLMSSYDVSSHDLLTLLKQTPDLTVHESEMVRLIHHMMRYSPTTKHKKGPSIPWGRITHMEDRYDGSRWWSFWKSVNRRTMMETMTHE